MRSSPRPAEPRVVTTALTPISPRRTEGSDLALLAEEGRAPVDLDAHDLAPAAPAGKAFPVVDLVLRLEVAQRTEEVAVLLVRQRGTAVLDRILEGLDHRPVEPAHFLGGERVG